MAGRRTAGVYSTPKTKTRTSSRLSRPTEAIIQMNVENKEQHRIQHLTNLENDNYLGEEAQETEDDFNAEEQDDDFGPPRKKKKLRRGDTGSRARQRSSFSNFAQVLDQEYYSAYPAHVPTYFTVAAAPSKLPERKFCSACGSFSHYICKICGNRFCCIKCNETHKENRCQKFTG